MTAPLDYPELTPPIRSGLSRRGGLDGNSRVQQLANRPHPIRDADRHGGCGLMPRVRRQGLMHPAEIVVSHVQRHGRRVVLQLL